MPIKKRDNKRRATQVQLEDLGDCELAEVWHFGNLVSDSGRVTFTARPSQQLEAGTILRRRGRIGLPPDPRSVLSGDPEAIEAVAAQQRAYQAARNALLRDG